MRSDCPGKKSNAAVRITATAFRDDRKAELVTLTELSFDGCELTSNQEFEVGERLRLYQRGQGWISLEVQWVSGSCVRAKFLTLCEA